MVPDEILAMLRCPEDRSTLAPASDGLIQEINRVIPAGNIRNRAGHRVEKPLDGGFIRTAADLLYPIVDQIPVMLVDEAIPLAQLDRPQSREMGS